MSRGSRRQEHITQEARSLDVSKPALPQSPARPGSPGCYVPLSVRQLAEAKLAGAGSPRTPPGGQPSPQTPTIGHPTRVPLGQSMQLPPAPSRFVPPAGRLVNRTPTEGSIEDWADPESTVESPFPPGYVPTTLAEARQAAAYTALVVSRQAAPAETLLAPESGLAPKAKRPRKAALKPKPKKK